MPAGIVEANSQAESIIISAHLSFGKPKIPLEIAGIAMEDAPN